MTNANFSPKETSIVLVPRRLVIQKKEWRNRVRVEFIMSYRLALAFVVTHTHTHPTQPSWLTHSLLNCDWVWKEDNKGQGHWHWMWENVSHVVVARFRTKGKKKRKFKSNGSRCVRFIPLLFPSIPIGRIYYSNSLVTIKISKLYNKMRTKDERDKR